MFLCSDKPNRAAPRPLEPDYPTNVKEFRASLEKPWDAVNGVTSCVVGERRKRMATDMKLRASFLFLRFQKRTGYQELC